MDQTHSIVPLNCSQEYLYIPYSEFLNLSTCIQCSIRYLKLQIIFATSNCTTSVPIKQSLSICLSFCLYQYSFLLKCSFLLSVESIRLPLCFFLIDKDFLFVFVLLNVSYFRNWYHRALQAKRYGSYF